MTINVRLFAILRQQAGVDRITLQLPHGARAADALVEISKRYPLLSLGSTAIAINQEYASRELPLHEGDELALIPPVSGG